MSTAPANPADSVRWALSSEPPEFTWIGGDAAAEQSAICGTEERWTSLQSIQLDQRGEWIEKFRAAGITAARRTSPDLLGQLASVKQTGIETVLCNLLDADPSVCLNAAIASRFPQEVIAGIALLGRLTGAKQLCLCADQRLPMKWWSSIRELAKKQRTKLSAIANDYPQSDPTLLLYTLLGRQLVPGRLPSEEGVIVIDAAAAIAVGRLFLADEPIRRVPVVVRDHARKLSYFLMVLFGTSIGDLLLQLGEVRPGAVIRGGDLLRDMKLPLDTVLGGGELVIHLSGAEPEINPNACIRCGWCTEACPTRVQPAAVLEAAQRDDIDLAVTAGIAACIECGICSYVCPSKLPLLEGIREMRKESRIEDRG